VLCFSVASTLVISFQRSYGYTLLEVIVVLLLLTVAASVVAPSLISRPPVQQAIPGLIGAARDAAVRRGESVRLRIDASGGWQVVAGAPPRGDILLSGRLNQPVGSTELIFSPLGTCAPDVGSLVPREVAIDPLTCAVRTP
jgi:prepilin-type N-terminal cleavage/methylation domain-containing protein